MIVMRDPLSLLQLEKRYIWRQLIFGQIGLPRSWMINALVLSKFNKKSDRQLINYNFQLIGQPFILSFMNHSYPLTDLHTTNPNKSRLHHHHWISREKQSML